MIKRGIYTAHGQPSLVVLDNSERTVHQFGVNVTTFGPWVQWHLLLDGASTTWSTVWDMEAVIAAGHYRHEASTEADYPKGTS